MNQERPVLKILIAEDDDAAAQLIKTNLRRSGLEAEYLRARNGEEAISLLKGAKTDAGVLAPEDRLLVLLDIRMPKVDGYGVLKAMRASKRLGRIPVVMLTTSDRPEEVDACYALGCSLYLKKQVDYAKFTEAIGKLAALVALCELPLLGGVDDE